MLDPAEILAHLDDEQRTVATTLDGPVVVLAGAGSGKTRAMTHRIAYGVSQQRFDPARILAVTFTTRAAGELRARLGQLGCPNVQARTFHSAALRQAQYFWPQAYGTALPPIEERRIPLVAEAAKRIGLSVETALLRDLASEITWAKVSNVAPEHYVELSTGRTVAGVSATLMAKAYGSYEELKTRRNVIDFDDILLCTAGLLVEHEDVREKVRATYRHFVVDEYQDVSPLQESVLRLWCGETPDLCVVGDPAQTIHSFAGARAEYLEGFTKNYPGARRIVLHRNYRSSEEIIGMANTMMGSRALKLAAVSGSGPAPTFHPATHDAAEAEAVAQWLRASHEAGTRWSEMAVLYRIHAQSPAFEAALSQAKVPYIVKGAEKFYDRAEVKQALSVLRRASDIEVDDVATHIRELLRPLGWTEQAPSGAGVQRERWESWNALLDVADDAIARVQGRQAQVRDVVVALDERVQTQQVPTAQGVTLTSIHAAKGLEWSAVALVGMQEGMMPFALADTDDKVAEERRLLYVGITRAKRHLRISWSQGRTEAGGSRQLTRFLSHVSGYVAPKKTSTSKRSRSTMLAATCRVCEGLLSEAAERKLGRHLTCESSFSEELLAELKAWRLAQAQEQGVPAYCIFTDVTLVAVAEAMPTDVSELAGISGVGAIKRQKYGQAVVDLVKKFE